MKSSNYRPIKTENIKQKGIFPRSPERWTAHCRLVHEKMYVESLTECKSWNGPESERYLMKNEPRGRAKTIASIGVSLTDLEAPRNVRNRMCGV